MKNDLRKNNFSQKPKLDTPFQSASLPGVNPEHETFRNIPKHKKIKAIFMKKK